MSDQQRQQNFAERLRRIEEKRGVAQPDSVQPSRTKSDYGYGVPEKQDYRLRNGIIWAFIIAAVGTGGYFGVKAIPKDITQAIAGRTSSPDTPETNSSSMVSIGTVAPAPAETETMSNQGPVLASPIVVHAGSDPLVLADLVASPDLTTSDTAIGQILPFARNAQCDLRDVLPSEKVVNVRIDNALLTAPIQAFSDAQLASLLRSNVEQVTQKNKTYDPSNKIRGQKSSLDVFLTDNTAPIYLVLQNMGQGVIWNVHTGPDVTLAHVAIIAPDHSGLVAPPNGATFEALLVSDFVPPHEFGLDDEVRDCMIRPWRNPQPDWAGSIKAERGNTLYENQMYTYSKGHAAYNSWYTQTLGVDASTNLVTARDAAHVLIGPKPSEPMTYRSMAGQDIHLMDTDNIFAGDTATRQSITDELHKNLLFSAIGGDISALNPAPMQRPTQ